jgi:flavodoxin
MDSESPRLKRAYFGCISSGGMQKYDPKVTFERTLRDEVEKRLVSIFDQCKSLNYHLARKSIIDKRVENITSFLPNV